MYPAPCMAGIPGTTLELAKPNCAGPAGTTIYIVVVSALKSSLAGVRFTAGQFGLAKSGGSRRHVPAGNIIVPVVLGNCPWAGFCLNSGSGNGMSLFSVYSWPTARAATSLGPSAVMER